MVLTNDMDANLLTLCLLWNLAVEYLKARKPLIFPLSTIAKTTAARKFLCDVALTRLNTAVIREATSGVNLQEHNGLAVTAWPHQAT